MTEMSEVVFHDERAGLYDTFMSDVLAIGGDPGSVAEIGRLLRSALESDCHRRKWADLDRRLASLLAGVAREPHHPAVARLYSYLRENSYDA